VRDRVDRAAAHDTHPVSAFFALAFALSIPFWIIGGVTDLEIVPGLPVAALMAICPRGSPFPLVDRISIHA
jgi:hypothetical protein